MPPCASDIAERTCYAGDIVRCVGEPGIEVGRNFSGVRNCSAMSYAIVLVLDADLLMVLACAFLRVLLENARQRDAALLTGDMASLMLRT